LETWTSKRSYTYFNKGGPQDVWEKCNEVVERHDENVCNDLKDEITFLMVVVGTSHFHCSHLFIPSQAGLFLAIVTAFTIESYKLLKEDKQDTMSDLLVELVRLLNDTSVQGHAQLPKHFVPDHRDVVVNQLWFLSSILSLVAVLIGTFCLQWISAFLRGRDLRDKSLSPTEVLGMRRLRYEGFIGWGVHHAPEVLLLIVQLSIALFTAGLVYFLWNINRAAAIPALVVAGITGILLYVVNVMPFLQSLIGVVFPRFMTLQCPYKSPTSWLVRIIFHSSAWTLSSLGKRWRGCNGVVGRFAAWLTYRPVSLRDYVWKAHDASFAALQHVWCICSELDSIGLGLSSALNILVLEPDAVDIIRHSMESLQMTFKKAENLRSVFGQTLPPNLKAIFNGNHTLFYGQSGRTLAEEGQVSHSKLLQDIARALILQNLVRYSVKLRRILLKHRMELYIRIKNSTLDLFGSGGCNFLPPLLIPMEHVNDIQSFDLGVTISALFRGNTKHENCIELKFQFLNYMNHSRHSPCIHHPYDYMVAADIIAFEGTLCLEPAQCLFCLRHQDPADHATNWTSESNLTEAQHMVPPNREEPGLLSSNHLGMNENRAEDPQFSAYKGLCFEVKEWLLSLPDYSGFICSLKPGF
jgi:hypothetical protein